MDKSRGSKSAEIRDIWDIYDHILQFIPADEAGAIDGALADGDPHLAWEAWSAVAERALITAFSKSGGPIPPRGLDVGRGKARFWTVSIGGKSMRKYRPSLVDPFGCYRSSSLSESISCPPMLTLKKGWSVWRACFRLSSVKASPWLEVWSSINSGLVMIVLVLLGVLIGPVWRMGRRLVCCSFKLGSVMLLMP